jgi:hypothetical protein
MATGNPYRIKAATFRAFIPTHVESIICRHRGGKARLVRLEPLPVDVEGEMLTFKCEKCGKESKTIVQA